MYHPFFHKIVKNEVAFTVIVSSAGISCGFITLLFFFNLPATFATFAALAMVAPLVVVLSGDSRRVLWALLIVCLPISVDISIGFTEHLGGTPGLMLSLYDVILAALYMLWIVELFHNKKRKIRFFPIISVPAFSLILYACLTMIPAAYPSLSIYEIIEIVKMYLTFFYLANNVRTKGDVQFIVSIFILLLFFEGFLGFGQHRYDRPFFPRALGGPAWVDSRVKGTWLSYNDFAWYLTCFLPIAMSMTFSQIKPFYKLICLVAVAVASASLLWTNSRAGWISFAVAVIIVGFLVFCKIKAKKTFINTVLSILCLSILVFPLTPRFYSKVYSRFTGPDRGSAASRFSQFEVAYDIIKAHPFLGVGINNYSEVMWQYDNTEEGLEQITRYPVHNIFLHITAEMGIFGLALVLWLLAMILYASVNYITRKEGFIVYAVIGMVAGILAFLIHGLFDTASIGSKMFLFIWFFTGIIFAAKEIAVEDQAAHLHLDESGS